MNPRESKEAVKLVNAYKSYIRNSARLVNFDNVPNSVIVKDINDMLKFESRLAKASSEFVDRRDHFGLYNKITIRQLQQAFPGASLTLSLLIDDLDVLDELVIFSLINRSDGSI